jgi:hypothetical protein
MWNSNSLISWLIERSGLNTRKIQPPAGGRAPGWNAGLVVARRPRTRRRSGSFSRWPCSAADRSRHGLAQTLARTGRTAE